MVKWHIKTHLCTIKTKFSSGSGNIPCNLTSPSNSVSKLHVGGKEAKILANVCIFGKSKGNVRRNDKVTVLTLQGYWDGFGMWLVYTPPLNEELKEDLTMEVCLIDERSWLGTSF